MAIIDVQGLTKVYRVAQKKPGLRGAITGLFHREYKTVRAVDGVGFSIDPGEMVAFLGPNGAGKTTTLKMLAGLIYPTSGDAKVLGYTPSDRDDSFRRQFSLVMGQKNQLWWDLPASDSFELHREIYSLPAEQFQTTLGELTELFRVGNLVKQPVRELSLGERMRMELIAALLHRPQLLLLDEPTIGLDVIGQATIQSCLREYNAARGVTVLLTSHYMRDVEAICKRVLVINLGKVVYDGPLSEIADRFGKEKIVRLQFGGAAPTDLTRWGTVSKKEDTFVELRMERSQVAKALATILDQHTVADMSVQDPPLEEVIAKIFAEGSRNGD